MLGRDRGRRVDEAAPRAEIVHADLELQEPHAHGIERSAHATIRGYLYQTCLGVLRWIDLKPGEAYAVKASGTCPTPCVVNVVGSNSPMNGGNACPV